MARRMIRTLLLTAVLVGVVLAFLLLPNRLAQWNRARQGNQAQVTAGTTFPLTVTDVCKRKITLRTRPTHIVSISPGATELLYAVGAGDRVIADTTYCDYPPAAAKLPKVGGYLDPSVEKIAALSPDLILGMRGTRKDILDRLYEMGLPIVVVDPTSLTGVTETLQLVGRVTGETEQAKAFVKTFQTRQQQVARLTGSIQAADRPRTLFLFSLDGGVYTAGPGSHIDELINLAGGRNIAAATKKPWPQLSMETVVQDDPQMILLLKGHGGVDGSVNLRQVLSRLRKDPHWQHISAVKAGKVVFVDDDLITLPGPRLVAGLEQIAAALHPDLFRKQGQ